MSKKNRKSKATKDPVFAFQDDGMEFRSVIGQGKFHSCININIQAWNDTHERPGKRREINIALSYYQAAALVEILENFVTSKRCHRKAQTPVTIKWDGATRWSTFPYPA